MNNTEKVLEKLSGTIEDRGELSSVSDYETLEAAILKYGAENQVDIAIEEMSELTKALLKERRQAKKGFDVSAAETFKMLEDDISEEMADVIIMLVQLQMIFNNKEEVSRYINSKVERLKARMGGGQRKCVRFCSGGNGLIMGSGQAEAYFLLTMVERLSCPVRQKCSRSMEQRLFAVMSVMMFIQKPLVNTLA